MKKFKIYNEVNAPIGSKELILKTKQSFGFVPNLLGSMAEAPALLEGYLALTDSFNSSSLSITEQQIVLMTNNRLNGCTYCMAAHTSISQGAKIDDEIIEALRDGTALPDQKFEALRQFTIKVNESRGWVDRHDVESFLIAGYSHQSVLEVILGTALKVMSNYTNHIAGTPLDAPFVQNEWTESVSRKRA
jgi:uncharacterized peroxidase-related enzyme